MISLKSWQDNKCGNEIKEKNGYIINYKNIILIKKINNNNNL